MRVPWPGPLPMPLPCGVVGTHWCSTLALSMCDDDGIVYGWWWRGQAGVPRDMLCTYVL